MLNLEGKGKKKWKLDLFSYIKFRWLKIDLAGNGPPPVVFDCFFRIASFFTFVYASSFYEIVKLKIWKCVYVRVGVGGGGGRVELGVNK